MAVWTPDKASFCRSTTELSERVQLAEEKDRNLTLVLQLDEWGKGTCRSLATLAALCNSCFTRKGCSTPRRPRRRRSQNSGGSPDAHRRAPNERRTTFPVMELPDQEADRVDTTLLYLVIVRVSFTSLCLTLLAISVHEDAL